MILTFARWSYTISIRTMYMRRSRRWNASSSRPISRSDGEVYLLSSTRLWRCGTHQGEPRSTPSFFGNNVWRSWVLAVRSVVADWDGFEQWDWGNFSKARTMGIDNLSELDFHKFTVCLLAFFIHSFVTRLGYYPSSLLLPPTLATHSCIYHAKKFGYALVTLPLSVE